MKDGRTFYHCDSLLTENRAGRKTEILCLIWIMYVFNLDYVCMYVCTWFFRPAKVLGNKLGLSWVGLV